MPRRTSKRGSCETDLCFFLPIVLLILCPIALIWVGVAVVSPYRRVQHFMETPSLCTVTMITTRGMIGCSNDQGGEFSETQSSFMCVVVAVGYNDPDTEKRVENVTLFDDPFNYYELSRDQCSTYVCEYSQTENNETVKAFLRQYGTVGQQVSCYPAEGAGTEALLSVIPLWHALLGMLLPATLFIIVVMYELFYCVICPRYCKGKSTRRSSAV